jgi:uncharacterized protein
MDYEYQPANHIAFRCAQRILVPDAFPKKLLRRQGGRATKVWTYPGFKEEVHLYDFKPNPAVLDEVGLAHGDAFVVVRPSPSGATYHQFGNPLFEEALHHLLGVHSVPVVVFARRPADLAGLESFGGRVIIPSESIDARSLIYYATALLGAGGTMNREAALLGTPAFTVFAGELAAVDRRLIEDGRLRLLSEGFTALDKQLTSRNGSSARERPHGDNRVLERFLEAILMPITTGRRQTCAG